MKEDYSKLPRGWSILTPMEYWKQTKINLGIDVRREDRWNAKQVQSEDETEKENVEEAEA